MTISDLFARRAGPSEVDEVFSRLRRRLPNIFSGADHHTLISDLPLDSLDVVELLCATEDEFGVLLTSDTCLNARTVGDLAQAIARRRTRPTEVTR